MISSNYIPEKVNNYNVYKDGEKLVGLAGEVELPTIKMKSSTVDGAGVLGEIDSPTIGQFESLEAKIKFNTLYSSIADITNPLKVTQLTLRAAQQVYDKTGGYVFKGASIVMGGRAKETNPGTLKKGDAMDSEVTMELTTYKIEVDGNVLVEIDKLNDVYRVNGEDMLAGIAELI